MKLLIKWIVLTASILFVSYLLDGIKIDNFLTALLAAAALGILNAILRPLLLILTLPINVLTFGVFTFIINAGLLMLVSEIIPGFHISGFWTAILGSILISITGALLNLLLKENRPPPPPPSPTGVIDLDEKEKGRWE